MTVSKSSSSKLDELISDVADKHAEITPNKDLWRGIEASISRSQVKVSIGRNRWLGWLSATAATVLVMTGVMLSAMHQSNTPIPNHQGIDLLTMLTEQHQQQRQVLLTSFNDAGYQQSVNELENELQQLRDAATQITAQLRLEPDNAELWQFLQWIHQQELDLLRTMYQQPRTMQRA
ncbi:hypothetical protein [Pseudidiomarina sp.]|uniref:hypothetical protein n=1 Tax=Pseudidiomarina sp. TaxID=2081707 RepID=UPI003A980446